MDLFLLNGREPCRDRLFLLPEERRMRIGRSPSCDVVLPYQFVSRVHCEVERCGEMAFVRDFRSRNGTRINQVRIHEDRSPLWPGDFLNICDTALRLVRMAIDWEVLEDPTVHDLAAVIYEHRDWDAMPILHDALLDAGCTDESILEHCLSEEGHGRGCWVLGLIFDASLADTGTLMPMP